MEYANVMIYIYDDMLSVSVDAPVSGTEDIFEKMCIRDRKTAIPSWHRASNAPGRIG